jgi:hypothetical protein
MSGRRVSHTRKKGSKGSTRQRHAAHNDVVAHMGSRTGTLPTGNDRTFPHGRSDGRG